MTMVSVVIPVFNEEANLEELHRRLAAMADAEPAVDWEFLCVDDGSTDASFDMLEKLAAADPRVKAIKLSRNFGSHTALLAGFTHASGDATVGISADMQDPPEMVPKLVRKWREGHDIVWAVRESRDDSWLQSLLAKAYYALMQKLALKDTPARGADVVLVSRRVRKLVVGMGHRRQFLFGAILWLGFSQASVPYHRGKRLHGRSKWSLSRRVTAAIDSFVSFSYFPIRFISYAGVTLSILGFVYAAIVAANAIFLQRPVQGYASLMVAVLVLSGFQLLMLGVVAEYLWRALQHVELRPLFVVDRMVGLAAEAPDPAMTSRTFPEG